ncbi:MAG: NADH pyrophosphatase zinc ribbon domain-containing protein, partial [Kineosporiaceae bacterium]
MTLTRLSLSRARVDRAGHRRAGPELMRVLLDDPATAVLPLRGPRAPITGPPGTPRLDLLAPATADERGDRDGAVLVFLGEDPQGRGYVLYAAAGPAMPPVAPGSPPEPGGPDEYGRRWADLRAVGDLLDDADAGLMTCAVAVASWHTRYGHCPRCGAATEVVQAGWARVCPGCGAEHYPRTDPAVIMSVVDEADRILLGRQVAWPPGHFSVLAGFVEPG